MQLHRFKRGLTSRLAAPPSIDRQIVWASTRLAGATIAIKALSAAKDLLAAKSFGVGVEMDAFFLSAAVPAFLTTMIGGALAAAILPAYVKKREREGDGQAGSMLASCMIVTGILCFTVAGLLAACGSYTIAATAWRVDSLVLSLATRLLYFSLATFVLSSLSMLLVAALTCWPALG
jgi:putative peptidoglycan lipid II flippase